MIRRRVARTDRAAYGLVLVVLAILVGPVAATLHHVQWGRLAAGVLGAVGLAVIAASLRRDSSRAKRVGACVVAAALPVWFFLTGLNAPMPVRCGLALAVAAAGVLTIALGIMKASHHPGRLHML